MEDLFTFRIINYLFRWPLPRRTSVKAAHMCGPWASHFVWGRGSNEGADSGILSFCTWREAVATWRKGYCRKARGIGSHAWTAKENEKFAFTCRRVTGNQRRVNVVQIEASRVAIRIPVAGMWHHHLVLRSRRGTVVRLTARVRVDRFPMFFRGAR